MPALLGRADLHVHTDHSDGRHTPEAIIRAASGRVDVVAITDHDTVAGAFEASAFARAHPELGVTVIVGEEVSTLNGHLIGLFLEARVPSGMSAERSIDAIHDQGGFAIVAHPLHPLRYARRGHAPLAALLPRLRVDAVEVVNNSGPLARVYDARAAAANEAWRLPVVGGSDAHDVRYLGSALTLFEGRDPAALRTALERGGTRARRNWRWAPAELLPLLRLKVDGFLRFTGLGGVRRPFPRATA